jgi:hypothetical protein
MIDNQIDLQELMKASIQWKKLEALRKRHFIIYTHIRA